MNTNPPKKERSEFKGVISIISNSNINDSFKLPLFVLIYETQYEIKVPSFKTMSPQNLNSHQHLPFKTSGKGVR